jgi:uncharacterized protein YaiL (DUF2058 family)
MRLHRLAVVLILAGMTAACGKGDKLKSLNDKIDSMVLKAQVALEDSVNSPRNVLDAETTLEERVAVKEAEAALQETAVSQAEALAKQQAEQKLQALQEKAAAEEAQQQQLIEQNSGVPQLTEGR